MAGRADHDSRIYYAHTRSAPDGAPLPEVEWQPLEDHLQNVAARAAGFAAPFGAAEWAYLAGLWHDMGKYQDAFQRHLAGDRQKVDHAVIGAVLAEQTAGEVALPLAFVIAGHHGGLADLSGTESGRPTPLLERLRQGTRLFEQARSSVPKDLAEVPFPKLPAHLSRQPPDEREMHALCRSTELWIRFLFSALVDADFLDTEGFMDPAKHRNRVGDMASLEELRGALGQHLVGLQRKARPTAINRLRCEILEACRERAASSPGIFSLTVPTGGGKTLSAMAFALEHALYHAKERVIVAIPYTSIIEQNAAVYRDVFGDENVIEHHANLDPERETTRNRLASENWDAPIIVTTNVQLFESLFSNRPSRCRKLHNVANSVILLDEVQSLPITFLHGILEVIEELRRSYGCTILLSTATQPAFRRRETFPIGFDDIAEIIPQPMELFDQVRRVDVDWRSLTAEEVSWQELADAACQHQQVLMVVHRRHDARELAPLLPDDGRYHLSALMCAAHRKNVIDQVKGALSRRETCRLVSTQLIEAGVDVDFPVVYRALGGLDSVAQAAGRCNREGTLHRGQVIVFRASTSPPRGTPRKGLDVTECMINEARGEIDICDPAAFERFFQGLYMLEEFDRKQVQTARQELKFATVAGKVRLIEEGHSHPVAVPYADSERRLADLATNGPTRERLRALQPFLVSLYDLDYQALTNAGALDGLPADAPVVWALTEPYRELYHEEFGLVVAEEPRPDPTALVVGD